MNGKQNNESFNIIISTLHMQAYKKGFRNPKYQFILPGWYPYKWWVETDSNRDLGCREEERVSVLEKTLAIRVTQFNDNKTLITEGGMVGVHVVKIGEKLTLTLRWT